jgi:Nitrate reductase cytochrome c-type subunit
MPGFIGPGAALGPGADWLQGPTGRIQDTLTGHFIDSVVVESPLPDPFVPVVQWFFQKPSWVMISGIVIGAIVAVGLALLIWRQRTAIARWIGTRERIVKLAMLGTVGAILLLVVGTGVGAYNYMMHDNDFCKGCHIFVPSGQAFVKPDTGTYLLVNAVEGAHDSLGCHACHPFEIKAQTRELLYWIADRPEAIPPHAKVPRETCEGCHVTGAAKKTWQRVASTAGHRVHLESDSSALKDVACLTCHARTAHRFQPADTTCAQKGCHLTDEVKIKLGRMATRFTPENIDPNEEELYCNSCHQFTAEAQFVSLDSAGGTLRPGEGQCFGCHEMRALLETFDAAKDPHSGSCGMCHNPHTDVKPEAARKSCADAGCHADWRGVAFHVGKAHRKVAEQCLTCHQPHAARADASDCTGCHTAVRKGEGRSKPPLPFDTLEALKQSLVPIEPPRDTAPRVHGLIDPGRSQGQGDAPPLDEPPPGGRNAPTALADTFSHRTHRKLACITCHSTSSRTDDLTFQPPRGCQICHHQRPAKADCAACHQSEEIAPAHPVTLTVEVPREAPRAREVGFEHASHAEVSCTRCHVTPVTLEPEQDVATCTACHDDHHAAASDCATCHRTESIVEAHAPPIDAHRACDECHTAATVAALEPTRSFCLACHSSETDHYQEKECSVCHLQATPGEYRARLTGGES